MALAVISRNLIPLKLSLSILFFTASRYFRRILTIPGVENQINFIAYSMNDMHEGRFDLSLLMVLKFRRTN